MQITERGHRVANASAPGRREPAQLATKLVLFSENGKMSHDHICLFSQKGDRSRCSKRTARRAIALAQGSSTIDTMASLQLLSRQLNEADADVRRQINDDLHERTGRVIRAVIEDREQRRSVARGQQSSYGSVRLYLFGVGALFVVLGKWLVLLHKSAAVNLTPKREADTQGLRGAIRRSRWPRTANPTKWRRR